MLLFYRGARRCNGLLHFLGSCLGFQSALAFALTIAAAILLVLATFVTSDRLLLHLRRYVLVLIRAVVPVRKVNDVGVACAIAGDRCVLDLARFVSLAIAATFNYLLLYVMLDSPPLVELDDVEDLILYAAAIIRGNRLHYLLAVFCSSGVHFLLWHLVILFLAAGVHQEVIVLDRGDLVIAAPGGHTRGEELPL